MRLIMLSIMMWSMMSMKTRIRMTTLKKDKSPRTIMRPMIIIITSMSPSSLLLNIQQQQQLLLQQQQLLQQQLLLPLLLLQQQQPQAQDRLSGRFLHSTLLLSRGSGGRSQLPIIKSPNLSKLDTTLTHISTTHRSGQSKTIMPRHDYSNSHNNDNSLILLGCAKNV